jgi:hypothetical protein
MKLVILMKICLNGTYGVCIGKHVSDNFPVQNGRRCFSALL